jgi:hypothetical protein
LTSGYVGEGFGELSKMTDQVLGEQIERLKKAVLGQSRRGIQLICATPAPIGPESAIRESACIEPFIHR